MENRLFAAAAIAALLPILASCGGGGGNGDVAAMKPALDKVSPPLAFPRDGYRRYAIIGLTPQNPENVQQMPVYHDRENIFVGIDQDIERIGNLPATGARETTGIRYGQLNDGVGRETLTAYLTEAFAVGAKQTRNPTVHVIGTASENDINRVATAITLVNASLPPSAKMSMGDYLPDFSRRVSASDEESQFIPSDEQKDSIYIEFVACSDYARCGGTAAASTWIHSRDDGESHKIANSYTQFNQNSLSYTNDRLAVTLLAHEMLHALGMSIHVSPNFDTILEATKQIYESQDSPQPTSLLFPVDREALQAVYGRLEYGDGPADFGPWESTSTHIVGVDEHTAFGVASRNSYAEPWAYGPMPAMNLANNPALSGTATWNGTLLGFTPNIEAVAGDAKLGVNLATMSGTADFTALESWTGAPGEVGTGTQWLDGDLGYAISVTGNTFRETSGDDGTLTGIFTGASHEGMGGTLERDDLTAAFGGSR